MSAMEHNKGKLIPFELNEETAKELVFEKDGDYTLSKYYNSYLEQVEDDPDYYGVALVDREFFKVQWEVQRGDLYGFAYVDRNEDGSISFNTYHYNGGAHWTEVVEEALINASE